MGDELAVRIALKADLMRSDMVRGLVWFVNYSAIDPTGVITAEDLDLHGATMLPEDLEKFAHRWLAFSRSIDIEHDGVGRPIFVAESFVNSPEVASPSWPLNTHLCRLDVSGSKEALDGLRTGALNSVSLDAYTFHKKVRLKASRASAAAAAAAVAVVKNSADVAGVAVRESFENVSKIVQVADGLFVAERSKGTPIGVRLADGAVEMSVADSVWSHISVALLTTPSLVSDTPPSSATDLGWAAGKHLHHHADGGAPSFELILKSLSKIDEIPEHLRQEAKAHLVGHLNEMLLPGGR